MDACTKKKCPALLESLNVVELEEPGITTESNRSNINILTELKLVFSTSQLVSFK